MGDSEVGMNWLIWSHEHQGYWPQSQCGYVPLSKAGRFTLEQATAICEQGNYGMGSTPEESILPEPLAEIFARAKP